MNLQGCFHCIFKGDEVKLCRSEGQHMFVIFPNRTWWGCEQLLVSSTRWLDEGLFLWFQAIWHQSLCKIFIILKGKLSVRCTVTRTNNFLNQAEDTAHTNCTVTGPCDVFQGACHLSHVFLPLPPSSIFFPLASSYFSPPLISSSHLILFVIQLISSSHPFCYSVKGVQKINRPIKHLSDFKSYSIQ